MRKKQFSKIASSFTLALFLSQVQLFLAPTTAHAETQVSDVKVSAIAGAGNITLSWTKPDSTETLSITGPRLSVEDESLAGTETASGFAPGERILLSIEIRSDVSDDMIDEIVDAVGASKSEAASQYESVEVESLTIEMPSSGFVVSSAQAASQPSATSFRYTTFIPQDKVEDLIIDICPVPPGSYFVGDDRSFDPSSTDYRTRVNVRVDWAAGGAVTWTKSVGLSTSYLQVLPLVPKIPVSWYANMDGIQVTELYRSGTHVRFEIDHNAADPLCLGAVLTHSGIAYNYDVTVQRSGNYGLVGWARRAPAHEAYIRDSNSSAWKTVFQRENKGFYCLMPFAEYVDCKAQINYSGSVN